MKKKNIFGWIIGIIILGVIIYYAYKYYQNKDNKKVGGGSDPTQADIDCASGGKPNASKMIIGSCTKPRIFPVVKPMREKCFTSEELGGIEEGGSAPSIVTDLNGFGTTWYLNYQSGDRFCYTNAK